MRNQNIELRGVRRILIMAKIITAYNASGAAVWGILSTSITRVIRNRFSKQKNNPPSICWFFVSFDPKTEVPLTNTIVNCNLL